MKLSLRNRNDRQNAPHGFKFAGLTLVLAAILAGTMASPTNAQDLPATPPAKIAPLPIADPSANPPAPPASTGPDGQQIVRDCAAALMKLPALSARIRQKIDLHGAQLSGTGSYLQLGGGENLLLRLSVKVQVEKHVTSLQQVCDGRFLWLRRDMPDGTSLQRIDLKKVRESYAGSGAPPSDGPWLAVGGLPRLIEGLAGKYQFGSPRAVKYGNQSAWQLEGDLHTEAAPGEKQAPPGEAIPRRVALVIGQNDHFPYRIEFQRQEKKKGEEEPNPWLPAMSLEFFDVEMSASLDPLQFVYKPDQTRVTEATEAYLRKFGGRPVEQARKPTQPR